MCSLANPVLPNAKHANDTHEQHMHSVHACAQLEVPSRWMAILSSSRPILNAVEANDLHREWVCIVHARSSSVQYFGLIIHILCHQSVFKRCSVNTVIRWAD